VDFPRNGGMIAAKRGDGNEQKTTPESQSGFQGEGGPGGDQGREERVAKEWWASFECFVHNGGWSPSSAHRLRVIDRSKPILLSNVTWHLKRRSTTPRTIRRAARRALRI